MGGVLILSAIGVATLFWADLTNPYIWILLIVMVIFGGVGWADDWLKIKHKDPTFIARKTFLASKELNWQLMYLLPPADVATTRAMQDLLIPVFKDFYIPFLPRRSG